MTWRSLLPSAIDRIRLGRAALQYAGHGWYVTPGAYRTGSRFACGRAGCPTMACHPALFYWAEAASRDPHTVAGWWRETPYTVLLATGRAFDVLEVPAYLGAPAATSWGSSGHPDEVRGPVAVSPTGRWMFLVRPGEPLRPELDGRLDVVRHGRGSWVPAPPTRLVEGPVRWAVAPDETGWRLPDPYRVQEALVKALCRLEVAPAIGRSTMEDRFAA
jgi:Bifunctional DNA primase/polymerase, N-terminal